MPFSGFARFSNGFRFSSRKPLGKAIYDSFRSSHSESFAEGGAVAARWFADAMAIGRCRSTLERAQNQADFSKCWDLLKAHERHFLIAVPSGASLHERRSALQAKLALVLGPVRSNVEYQLEAALGVDFVAWVTTPASSSPVTYSPVDPWDMEEAFPHVALGIFGSPPVWTRVQLQSSIAFLGSRTVEYDTVGGENVEIAPGDRLVIDPYRRGLRELVEVTAADTDPYTFTAEFTKAHESGTDAIIWPFPYWLSWSLHSLVIVPNGRAMDTEVRRKANEVMRRIMGGNSTWDIVEESTTPGQCVGFEPGIGAPGITPIQALSF